MKQKDSKKKKKTCVVPCAFSTPGQQIGLYGKAGRKDVRQMVKMLNPGKHSMESRG